MRQVTIGVWTDAPVSGFAEPPPWLFLNEGVRRRISRLRNPKDRRAAIQARALTVLAAAQALDVPPRDVHLRQECHHCHREDHGRPSLRGLDLHVSWAHTRTHVVAAVSPLAVAVDTEERVEATESLTERALTRDEREWLDQAHDLDGFTRLWCRKECAVKLGWIDLDRLSDVSFCAGGVLLRRLRGASVAERSIDGRTVVAITETDLRWIPSESLMRSGSVLPQPSEAWLR